MEEQGLAKERTFRQRIQHVRRHGGMKDYGSIWELLITWGSTQCGRENGGQGGWKSTRDQSAYLMGNQGEYKMSEQETGTQVRK